MCPKLLTLCICCCNLVATALTATPLFNAPLDPDVELLPTTVSAVSSQFIHRIHNKLISAPVVAPIIVGNSAFMPAPLRTFPVPVTPALHANYAISSPLTSVPRPPASLVPVTQQVAPLVSSFNVFPQILVSPRIIPAPLVSTPTRVFTPAARIITPTRFAVAPLFSRRLRARLNFIRPSAISLRRYPSSPVY